MIGTERECERHQPLFRATSASLRRGITRMWWNSSSTAGTSARTSGRSASNTTASSDAPPSRNFRARRRGCSPEDPLSGTAAGLRNKSKTSCGTIILKDNLSKDRNPSDTLPLSTQTSPTLE
ncbi:UNVERIFIED_CONTAM: hypothetical protein GTU68_057247 [Idotea baltica]|nr:hypothetical protein [Idotea baltica]